MKTLIALSILLPGILLDLVSFVAFCATCLRKRWYSGFPGVPLLFYVLFILLLVFGVSPRMFSPQLSYLFTVGLIAFHFLLHGVHGCMRKTRCESPDVHTGR